MRVIAKLIGWVVILTILFFLVAYIFTVIGYDNMVIRLGFQLLAEMLGPVTEIPSPEMGG